MIAGLANSCAIVKDDRRLCNIWRNMSLSVRYHRLGPPSVQQMPIIFLEPFSRKKTKNNHTPKPSHWMSSFFANRHQEKRTDTFVESNPILATLATVIVACLPASHLTPISDGRLNGCRPVSTTLAAITIRTQPKWTSEMRKTINDNLLRGYPDIDIIN